METNSETVHPEQLPGDKVLAEQHRQEQQTLKEVREPFEDEADRSRAKALESHHRQVLRPAESDLQKTTEALITERNQPILDEHQRLEKIRLNQLRAEVKAGQAPTKSVSKRNSGNK